MQMRLINAQNFHAESQAKVALMEAEFERLKVAVADAEAAEPEARGPRARPRGCGLCLWHSLWVCVAPGICGIAVGINCGVVKGALV